MTQQMIINVDASRPLSSYGDGHMLMYDNRKKCYMVVTRDSLLSPLTKRIDDLYEEFERLKAEMAESYETFTSGVKEEEREFLETYKMTNSALIEMVESVVEDSNNKEAK